MGNELNPREFLDRRESGEEMTLLDVREDWEVALAPVPTHTVHIPMATLSDRIGELDPNKETVVICRSGGRSAQVAQFLERQGFGKVFNLSGGILAWSRVIDPRIPQY
ncbi:MAG: rhodanese-like domain-containing protein [Pseudomonadota bacterium]|nr:rhodanese-like domain-containing protein [Pseudomonadota bacterium]